MKWRLMPRDFFQYLVKMRRVFVAAEFASCFDEQLKLFFVAIGRIIRLSLSGQGREPLARFPEMWCLKVNNNNHEFLLRALKCCGQPQCL